MVRSLLPHLYLFTPLPSPCLCQCRVSQILFIPSFLCTETIGRTTSVWRLAPSHRPSFTGTLPSPAFTGFRSGARSPQARSRLECARARLRGPEGLSFHDMPLSKLRLHDSGTEDPNESLVVLQVVDGTASVLASYLSHLLKSTPIGDSEELNVTFIVALSQSPPTPKTPSQTYSPLLSFERLRDVKINVSAATLEFMPVEGWACPGCTRYLPRRYAT